MGEKDFRSLIEEFPEFKEGDIVDLRLQFQTFDLNQDGIIDFKELMQVLDDLGDRSEPSVRQQYFNEIDKDGSGAIDFEEFLALIYQLRKKTDVFNERSEFGQIGSLYWLYTFQIWMPAPGWCGALPVHSPAGPSLLARVCTRRRVAPCWWPVRPPVPSSALAGFSVWHGAGSASVSQSVRWAQSGDRYVSLRSLPWWRRSSTGAARLPLACGEIRHQRPVELEMRWGVGREVGIRWTASRILSRVGPGPVVPGLGVGPLGPSGCDLPGSPELFDRTTGHRHGNKQSGGGWAVRRPVHTTD
ncbi:hypothetical protein ACROYT_G009619 [Oculina patagonica]